MSSFLAEASSRSVASASKRRLKRPVHGILLLDKPTGISSNRALQVARRALGATKGGHTGNLDVAASGLLPLCFGEATKVCGFLLEADKRYQATVRLGVTTASGDAEGEVLSRSDNLPGSRALVEDALTTLRGPQMQIPPMYSALKRDGQPLYKLARQGIEVERQARPVVINRLDMLALEGETVVLDVSCSKGTYIRSLAVSLGEILGCGASLSGLRRLEAGPYDITHAHSLDLFEGERYPPEVLEELLLPIDSALQSFPQTCLDAEGKQRVCQGQVLHLGTSDRVVGLIRLYGPDGEFLGMGEGDGAGQVQPRRLMATVKDPD